MSNIQKTLELVKSTGKINITKEMTDYFFQCRTNFQVVSYKYTDDFENRINKVADRLLNKENLNLSLFETMLTLINMYASSYIKNIYNEQAHDDEDIQTDYED